MLEELTTLKIPTAGELGASAQAFLRGAMTLATLQSPEDRNAAAEDLADVVARRNELNERRLKITRPMDKAKAEVMDLFRKPIAALDEAESILKGAILAFDRAQAEAARREREAAEREAAEARARAAEEAAALAAKAAKETDAAAAATLSEQAAAASLAAATIVAPVAIAEPPKSDGVSKREDLEFEVTDVLALAEWVCKDRRELAGILSTDAVKLRSLVRSMGRDAKIPGVRVFVRERLAVRAKK